MQIDWNIITKMNALADDFRDEAERQRIEAERLRDNNDLKGYFASMRKYGEYTKRQIEVLIMEIDVSERTYDLVLNRRNGIEE